MVPPLTFMTEKFYSEGKNFSFKENMTLLNHNLMSLSTLISLAKSKGADFDGADPKEHIFYLSKIGLLPKAIKKTNENGKLEAHYPSNVIETFFKIYSLKKSGLAYSQIGKFINLNSQHALPSNMSANENINSFSGSNTFVASSPNGFVVPTNHPVVFLLIGLILGYLVNANGALKINSTNSVSTKVATIKTVDSDNQSLFQLLTTQNANTNNDLYLISLPKNNFSKLEKVRVTDLSGQSDQTNQ